MDSKPATRYAAALNSEGRVSVVSLRRTIRGTWASPANPLLEFAPSEVFASEALALAAGIANEMETEYAK